MRLLNPLPTRWPEPGRIFPNDDIAEEPISDPDYDVEEIPEEEPTPLPEE